MVETAHQEITSKVDSYNWYKSFTHCGHFDGDYYLSEHYNEWLVMTTGNIVTQCYGRVARFLIFSPGDFDQVLFCTVIALTLYGISLSCANYLK